MDAVKISFKSFLALKSGRNCKNIAGYRHIQFLWHCYLAHMRIPFFKNVGIFFFSQPFLFWVDFGKAFGQKYVLKIDTFSYEVISKFNPITYVYKFKKIIF